MSCQQAVSHAASSSPSKTHKTFVTTCISNLQQQPSPVAPVHQHDSQASIHRKVESRLRDENRKEKWHLLPEGYLEPKSLRGWFVDKKHIRRHRRHNNSRHHVHCLTQRTSIDGMPRMILTIKAQSFTQISYHLERERSWLKTF